MGRTRGEEVNFFAFFASLSVLCANPGLLAKSVKSRKEREQCLRNLNVQYKRQSVERRREARTHGRPVRRSHLWRIRRSNEAQAGPGALPVDTRATVAGRVRNHRLRA